MDYIGRSTRWLGSRAGRLARASGLVGAGVILGWLLWPESTNGGEASASDRLLVIEARIEAMEKRQAEQFEEIARRLSIGPGDAGRALSPEQARREAERREHKQRMREDPAYALQVQEKRLAGLHQKFTDEPVEQRWSTETRSFTNEALVSAAVQAGAKLEDAEVDCRSQTCRIAFALDTKHAYDDVLTYLMTDLAEVLPGAELVVMPPVNGVRKVNIYARKVRNHRRQG